MLGRRPPKMMALIGTPSGFSQSGSTLGHWRVGAVKRALGCAALRPQSGRPVLALPVDRPGRAAARSCPPTTAPPSGVRATLVKIEFFARVAMAFGLVLAPVPGATPKKPASGLMACSRPSAPGLIQAMSSPTVHTFQPLKAFGGIEHGEIGLPAGARERGRDVGLLAPRILHAEDQHVLGHPALVAGDVRGDAQREALSCPAARCRRSPSRRTRSRASPESARCISGRGCTARAHPSGPSSAARPRNACRARPAGRPGR